MRLPGFFASNRLFLFMGKNDLAGIDCSVSKAGLRVKAILVHIS